jgi:hypothetical protein
MRWTGNAALPRGVHRSQLTMNVDYAETMLAAAGVTPGRVEDGVSLLPLWRDGGKELGRDLLIDNTPGSGHFDAIRSRHFLYAEYANGDRELYDLVKDPYELQSQHANPAYDGIKAGLAARLHTLVSCSGATCRVPPAMRLRTVRHGCSVTATVTGAAIRSVGFSVNHRGLKSDVRSPFRVTVRVRGSAFLRARVAAGVDRLVSVDRTVRGC